MEEYYESGDHRFKEINYEKINKYISMIDTGEIAPDMIRSALHSITNELRKINYESSFNQHNLDTFKRLCVVIGIFIQDKEDDKQRTALEALSPLKENEETNNIVKKYCYETFKLMHQQGKSHTNLLKFLDSFGYFQNIEETLTNAIDNRDSIPILCFPLDFYKNQELLFQ